jgi:hypothetical protein
MKNLMNIKGIISGGSVAGTCLMVSVAFANPAMLPDHPGHPMAPLKSPVTGQSLANDPGRESGLGQKALEASTAEEGQEGSKSPMRDVQNENKLRGIEPMIEPMEEKDRPTKDSQK